MFVLDLPLLAFSAVICSDPGVSCVFIDPKVAGRLRDWLI
jgi:hypothetical protein